MENVDVTQAEAPVSEPASVSEAPETGGSLRDSIDRAFASVDRPEGQEAPKVERSRDEIGRFAKEQAKAVAEKIEAPVPEAKPVEPEKPKEADEAPSRFSPDAKAAWTQAPAAVRGEIKRAITELETGINQYRQAWEPLRQYHDMAVKSGTTLDKALANYTGVENLLRTEPLRALEHICSNVGLSLRDVAAHVMGQTPDQAQSQSDATIRELRNQVMQLQQQVQGFGSTFEQQQQAELVREVEQFKASNPRFDELRPEIARLLDTGFATDLADAYSKADRLNPAPAPQQALPVSAPPMAQPAVAQATPDPAIQTRKGSLSISGAPSSGSNPANRKPSGSPRESVDRAFASLGL